MLIQSANIANIQQSKSLAPKQVQTSEAPQVPGDLVDIAYTNEGRPAEASPAAESAKKSHTFLKLAGAAGVAGLAMAALPGFAHAAEAGTTAVAAAAAPAASAAAPAAASGLQSALNAVSPFLPIVGIGLMGFMVYRAMKQGGPSNNDPTTATSGKVAKSDKTFADVAGIPEAKEELMTTVEFLKNPAKFAKLGAKMPRGVLLSGPPGTGKTLLAKAVAGEAGVNFIQATGSDFSIKWVGDGAKKVRELFQEARKNAPCIIFIDEIDAVGKARSEGGDGASQESGTTLNALLTQMDGFNTTDGIIVMGATNRPEMLDSALVRSGRFDTKVTVGQPNREGREAILKVHARNKPVEPGDISIIADRTTGMVGADLENILNKAAIRAAKENTEKITLEQLSKSVDDVAMGPEMKSRRLTEDEKRVTGYHEAGHATISKALPSNGMLMKVSILPRGQAAGVCWTNPVDNKSMYSRQDLEDHICMLLGGAAAEELKIGKNFTGPSNDIERATEAAKGMVTEYGMAPNLGKVKYVDGRSRDRGLMPSQQTQRDIDEAVKGIIDGQWARAKAILTKNDAQFTQLAETLIQKEELDRPELEQIMVNVSEK